MNPLFKSKFQGLRNILILLSSFIINYWKFWAINLNVSLKIFFMTAISINLQSFQADVFQFSKKLLKEFFILLIVKFKSWYIKIISKMSKAKSVCKQVLLVGFEGLKSNCFVNMAIFVHIVYFLSFLLSLSIFVKIEKLFFSNHFFCMPRSQSFSIFLSPCWVLFFSSFQLLVKMLLGRNLMIMW